MDDSSSKQKGCKNQMDNINLVSDMLGNFLNNLPQSDWPVSFIPSGFPSIDQLTNGLETSSLITVIGRPEMGKTSFALDLALFAATQGRKVVFFSYDMNKADFLERLLSKQSSLSTFDIRFMDQMSKESEWLRLIAAAEVLRKAKIYFVDNPANTVEDIREICSQIENIGLIFVDYFQLVGSSACYADADEISSYVSRILKRIAEENKAPVICLAQLSPKTVLSGVDDKPVLSDLRASPASVLQTASDVVIGLYRDSYYCYDDQNNSAEAIILKSNWSLQGTAKLGWNNECLSFYSIH